jgi:hypothetical protein
MCRASPEMRPGSHHDDWAATPQAAPQSLGKTRSELGRLLRVTKMAATLPSVIGNEGCGQESAGNPRRNCPARLAAAVDGVLVTSTAANATPARNPTNQLTHFPAEPVSGAVPAWP